MDGLDPVRRMAFIHRFFHAVSKHRDPAGAVNSVCSQAAHWEWWTPSTGHENLRRGHKGGRAARWWGVTAWRCGRQARLPRRTEEGKTGLGEITGHRETGLEERATSWQKGEQRREPGVHTSGRMALGEPRETGDRGWRGRRTGRGGTSKPH